MKSSFKSIKEYMDYHANVFGEVGTHGRIVAEGLAELAVELAARPEVDALDAARYRFLRGKVFARLHEHGGRNDYHLSINVPQREETNIMKGGIACHLDDEIDAAMKRDEPQGEPRK